ncbi:MAG: hypothetical protein ACI30A_06705 [Paludibacteraceae bacterium]
MKTSVKITISCVALLAILTAVFFAAPYSDYKKAKAEGTQKSYLQHICKWWKTKFQGKTIDGGMLPEITVTPQN